MTPLMPLEMIGKDNMYKVYDSLGNFIKRFPTFQQASNYKLAYGNNYWVIKM